MAGWHHGFTGSLIPMSFMKKIYLFILWQEVMVYNRYVKHTKVRCEVLITGSRPQTRKKGVAHLSFTLISFNMMMFEPKRRHNKRAKDMNHRDKHGYFTAIKEELDCAKLQTNLSFWDDFSRGERLLKEKQNNCTPKEKKEDMVSPSRNSKIQRNNNNHNTKHQGQV